MAGKMPASGGAENPGLPNFDFSALQNVLNVRGAFHQVPDSL